MVQPLKHLRPPESLLDFNTSYVVVQPVVISTVVGTTVDFNTSYVVVQLSYEVAARDMSQDFNTSYVVVQPLLVCDCYFLLY